MAGKSCQKVGRCWKRPHPLAANHSGKIYDFTNLQQGHPSKGTFMAKLAAAFLAKLAIQLPWPNQHLSVHMALAQKKWLLPLLNLMSCST